MPRVTNVRLLRSACAAILLAASADSAVHLFAASPANTAQPRVLTAPRMSPAARSSAPVNPLRAPSTGRAAQPVQATKVRQLEHQRGPVPSPPAPAKKLAPPPKSFVPNTGRLQIFRAATKAELAERALERSPLFPQGTPATRGSVAKHVMRYQDVARGAALVPIKPRTNDAAPASPNKPAARTPAPAPEPEPELEPELKRLPPLDRTAPRPKLPPGVKLPQEPIKIYPETDS